MRRTLTALGVAVLVGQVSFSQSRPGISELATGKSAARAGHYNEAISALESAVAAFRNSQKMTGPLAEAYVYLGMAQVGLGRDSQARESFRRALAADGGRVLKRAEFPARVLELYQAAGGRVEPPPRTARKTSIVPWIAGGAVGVGAPVVAIATKEDSGPKIDPVAFKRDDDGDGLSEEQGDCKDEDSATNPNGKIEARFTLLMSGEVDCTHPYQGTEQITVTNHSCTAEWVSVFRTGTYLRVRPSGYVTTDMMVPWSNSVSVAPGATEVAYSRDSRPLTSDLDYPRPDCDAFGGVFRYTEIFTVRSSQGEQRQTRTYSYAAATCGPCSQ